MGQHGFQTGVDHITPAQHTILHQAANSRTTPTITELQWCPPTHPTPLRPPSLHPPALCTPVAVPATSPVEGQAWPAADWRGTHLDGFSLTSHPPCSPPLPHPLALRYLPGVLQLLWKTSQERGRRCVQSAHLPWGRQQAVVTSQPTLPPTQGCANKGCPSPSSSPSRHTFSAICCRYGLMNLARTDTTVDRVDTAATSVTLQTGGGGGTQHSMSYTLPSHLVS